MNDDSSLSHTRWNCKYHIVFVPKYRRKVIYGKLRAEIGAILRQLCAYKDVEIIEAHAMPDHIHMLVKIPPALNIDDITKKEQEEKSLIKIDDNFRKIIVVKGNIRKWKDENGILIIGLKKFLTCSESIYS